jgi:hypothetical protein
LVEAFSGGKRAGINSGGSWTLESLPNSNPCTGAHGDSGDQKKPALTGSDRCVAVDHFHGSAGMMLVIVVVIVRIRGKIFAISAVPLKVE